MLRPLHLDRCVQAGSSSCVLCFWGFELCSCRDEYNIMIVPLSIVYQRRKVSLIIAQIIIKTHHHTYTYTKIHLLCCCFLNLNHLYSTLTILLTPLRLPMENLLVSAKTLLTACQPYAKTSRSTWLRRNGQTAGHPREVECWETAWRVRLNLMDV